MITLQSISSNKVTLLSNLFIDCYMPKANGEFVKVYIYLLRIINAAGEGLSLTQMADSLLCTEGDILRALKYWESEKLLTLTFGSSGLEGIVLAEIPEQASPGGHSPLPGEDKTGGAPKEAHGFPAASFGGRSGMNQTGHFASSDPADSPASGDMLAVSQAPQTAAEGSFASAPDAATPSKKSLTPDRVKELKQNEDIIQLLYIAEQYLGKTLTPTETRSLLFFYDELKMSVELIDYLIEYCVSRGHKSFRYIETVAMAWHSEGITTVEMAKDSTSRYSREYFTILKSMGITNRNPVDTEVAIMNTWMKDYGFTMDLIEEACSRTVLATGQPSFQYADKILSDWMKKGVKTMEDVRVQDARHQKRRQDKTSARTPAPKASNRFNNFRQREYDFEEYEKKLLNQ